MAGLILDLRELARALRGEVLGLQVLAPGPGHSLRDRSLSVKLSVSSPDGFLTHSFAGDDWRDCRDYVRERLGLERENSGGRPSEARRRAPDPRREDDDHTVRDLASAAAYVAEMRPVRATPGERYLRNVRRIDTDAIADVLERTDAIGWHPAVCFHEPGHALHGQRVGCIVGVMTDPVTAKSTGAISRTYLDSDLRKIGKAKSLGSPAGIVRLSYDEDVLCGLVLAEGLETALTAMAIGLRPTWSTGSTSQMAKFPLLSAIESLTVIADHDRNSAGEKAARTVEATWRRGDREVRILRPSQFGDLNDVFPGLSR